MIRVIGFFIFFWKYCNGNTVNISNIFSEKDILQVQEHYLNYPYPFVNPANDNTNQAPLQKGPYLEEINHYLFRGNGDFGRRKIFRILIAGGGTGSSLLHYSYIFKNRRVEIVYLDFSKKSLNIARSRAENYGFKNISYHHNSIFNIPKLNLGKFDLIDCYGVLHHLSDPDEGLRILKESLTQNGGMFLMLYAYYGRQGLYLMQDLLHIVNSGRNLSYQDEIKFGRTVHNNLFQDNWIYISGIRKEEESDVGFYDMYLNKQDRAFTIPELYEYIEDKGNLHIVEFFDHEYRNILNINYNYLRKLSKKKRFAINEITFGHEIKQSIFVSNVKNSSASLNNMDNIPFFCLSKIRPILNVLSSTINTKFIKLLMNSNTIFHQSFLIPVSRYTLRFIKLMLRNKYTIDDMINDATIHFKKTDKETMDLRKKLILDFNKTFKAMIQHGLVLLRHKTLSKIPFMYGQSEILSAEAISKPKRKVKIICLNKK